MFNTEIAFYYVIQLLSKEMSLYIKKLRFLYRNRAFIDGLDTIAIYASEATDTQTVLMLFEEIFEFKDTYSSKHWSLFFADIASFYPDIYINNRDFFKELYLKIDSLSIPNSVAHIIHVPPTNGQRLDLNDVFYSYGDTRIPLSVLFDAQHIPMYSHQTIEVIKLFGELKSDIEKTIALLSKDVQFYFAPGGGKLGPVIVALSMGGSLGPAAFCG